MISGCFIKAICAFWNSFNNVIPAEAGIQYMKFTIDWLKEFCPVRFSVKELAHRLTLSGLEVEHIEEEGDTAIFTLGITPNRGDCLSLLGVAREVSAFQGKSLIVKTKFAGFIKVMNRGFDKKQDELMPNFKNQFS